MTKILHLATSKPVLRSFAWRGCFMFDFRFCHVMWRIFFVSEALTSAMKRSGFGRTNSGQCLHQRLWEKGVTRRAVDHEGEVLEGYVSKSRDQKPLWKSIKRNSQYKLRADPANYFKWRLTHCVSSNNCLEGSLLLKRHSHSLNIE